MARMLQFPAVARASLVILLLAAALTPTAHAATVPPQGIYEQCAPSQRMEQCLANLRRVGKAGLKVVINYQALDATPGQLKRYARVAHKAGVKLAWPLIAPTWRGHGDLFKTYHALGDRCVCDNLLDYVVRTLRKNPATWGWYVGDELPVSEAPNVTALARRVQRLDPKHPRLYMQAGLTGLFGEGLAPFAPAVTWLGNDIFPYGTTFSPTLVASTMRRASEQARGAGRKFVGLLQAFSWNQVRDRPSEGITDPNHFPTYAEMLQARNDTIRVSRPNLLLWYSLQDIDNSDNPSAHFADLVRVVHAPAP